MIKWWTQKEYKYKLFNKFHGYIKLVNNHIKGKKKLCFKCAKGHIFWYGRYNIFKIGQNGCRTCNKIDRRKYNQHVHTRKILNYIKNKTHNKYELLGKYITAKSKLLMRCPYGHNFYIRPNDFLNGHRCSYCAGDHHKDTKYFAKEVKSLTDGKYKVIGKYNKAHKKIKMLCPMGHIFYIEPNQFLKGTRCAECSQKSKGETRIKHYLSDHSLVFKHGYISNCKYKGYLHFDFWNLNYLIAIEYDGIQHFKPKDFSGKKTWEQTVNYFHKIQNRDAYKDIYCALNGIKLIRIKYTDYDNIEKILDQNFKDQLLVKN